MIIFIMLYHKTKCSERGEEMDVKVNLSGMEELQKALDDATAKLYELHKAVTEIHSAFIKVGMEINQPSADTDD